MWHLWHLLTHCLNGRGSTWCPDTAGVPCLTFAWPCIDLHRPLSSIVSWSPLEVSWGYVMSSPRRFLDFYCIVLSNGDVNQWSNQVVVWVSSSKSLDSPAKGTVTTGYGSQTDQPKTSVDHWFLTGRLLLWFVSSYIEWYFMSSSLPFFLLPSSSLSSLSSSLSFLRILASLLHHH